MDWRIIGNTFLLAAAGGLLFQAVSIPLPWMLGPLTLVVIWSQVMTKPVCWPPQLRNASLVLLGYMIGKAFTATAAQQMLIQLPVMFLVTVVILGMSLLLGYLTHIRTGISLSTGLMGSVPGGFAQMVLMSGEIADTDVSVVSFMHTTRLLSVIVIVPYLATQAATATGAAPMVPAVVAATAPIFAPIPTSAFPLLALAFGAAFLAHRLRWPTPFLLGPIFGIALASMIGTDCPSLPTWLTILSQISVGAYMGTQIQVKSLSNWPILLAYTMLGVVLVIATCLGSAYFLAYFYGFSDVTAFLSMAPGGVAEMSVTGLALHADLSVIASYQMFRLFFLMLMTPMMFRKYLKPARVNT
ncbi:MAG: AbrB family transcriptional regulator [Negativicutes bacterium]